jgi:hypothetical protein
MSADDASFRNSVTVVLAGDLVQVAEQPAIP